MLWSDICFKSEKLEFINRQPENYKDVFSGPGEPECSIRCNFTLLSSIFRWQRKMTYIIHATLKFSSYYLFFLFFKKGILQGSFLRD